MPGEGEKSRSYHSEDKRRSVSREDARQLKLQRVKQRFKNIATRIREIKQENTSDLTQLGSLMRGSEEIEKMAHQSLEKATLFLSESKLHSKRLVSPPFHESKHAPQEFVLNPSEPPTSTPASKRKGKSGKRPAAVAHIKTDETNESEALKEFTIEQISEISLHQEQSGIREQSMQQPNHCNVTPIHPPSPAAKRETTEAEAKESRVLRQSGSNSSLLKASRNASTQGSMRTSLRRNLQPTQDNGRKVESIFPFIAIILFSILFLLWLRT